MTIERTSYLWVCGKKDNHPIIWFCMITSICVTVPLNLYHNGKKMPLGNALARKWGKEGRRKDMSCVSFMWQDASLLPVKSHTAAVLLLCCRLSWGHWIISMSSFSLGFSCSLFACPLSIGCLFIFVGLPLLPLSALILRRSPAHSILFALRQDKHCPCVTLKIFHRPTRFKYISIIGFFLLWECLRERTEKKEKQGKEVWAMNGRGQLPFPSGPH